MTQMTLALMSLHLHVSASSDFMACKINVYYYYYYYYYFVAIAVESLGPINKNGSIFLREIGKRLTTISGDPRETSFLLQRISVTLQCYNAIAFRGSFQEVSGLTDWGLKGSVVLLGSILWISRDHYFVPGAKKKIIIIIISNVWMHHFILWLICLNCYPVLREFMENILLSIQNY